MSRPYPHEDGKEKSGRDVRRLQRNAQAKWKEALTHGLLALLYGLGLLWTLLGALELTAHALPMSWVTAGTVLALLLFYLPGWTRWLGLLPVASGLGWLLLPTGRVMLEQAVLGVTLHMSGVPAALPLVAQETALLLAVACGVIGMLLMKRSVGAYPAIVLVLLTLLLLWLSDQAALLVLLLPSVLAMLALMALSYHEGLRMRRVLPMMTAITLLAGAVIPTGGVTIQPLKDAADWLRQRIYDHLFYTESRDVFSLAMEGFYPQGRSQLGGAPSPSERDVMLVYTPRRTYLRGVIKNQYTGRSWMDNIGGRRYLWSSLRWQEDRIAAFDELRPGGAAAEHSLLEPSQVTVRMLSDSASTLFVPQRIRELSPGGDLVPYFNGSSEVFITRNLEAGDTWTVEAPLLHAGDGGLGTLIAACALNEDPYFDTVLEQHTELPSHLPEELYHLAWGITQDAAMPYDKAMALQGYLSANYRYTLEVEPQPTDIDFVTNFLLLTKEGYCTYFASALTVLCRMAGLPARYVEGYVAMPDASGSAVVTGLDAHAWTEVYFSGFGWLTFDATPWSTGSSQGGSQPEENPQPTPTPTPQPTPPSASSAPESDPAPEDTQEPEQPTPPDGEAPQEPRSYALQLWWLLPLLLLAALMGRILWTQPAACARRARDDKGRWLVWTQAVHDVLHVLKLHRQGCESPMAFMRRLDDTLHLPVRLSLLGEDEATVFYGRALPDPEAVAEARRVCTALLKELSPWKRLRLTLRRAFLPARSLDFTRRPAG